MFGALWVVGKTIKWAVIVVVLATVALVKTANKAEKRSQHAAAVSPDYYDEHVPRATSRSPRPAFKRWFDRRKKEPDSRKSSGLDSIIAETWHPEWTTELLELINVLGRLVLIQSEHVRLLDRLLQGPLLAVGDLTAEGLLPPKEQLKAEKPQAVASLFEGQ